MIFNEPAFENHQNIIIFILLRMKYNRIKYIFISMSLQCILLNTGIVNLNYI